ncbi:MAG: methylmalonyl Co-A mutase-associated GTPase MeaB [Candidatus Lokiarchaeota archaeon]|nr:methylmalonyl Co-A mutase-associated GTPase MeaB [Candidatus Lokiarchaeota archaeon]
MMSMEIDDLVARMRTGDRRAVARLMTLAESDIMMARAISSKIFKDTGKAYVIGVTGSPGSGKSSLVNQLISLLAKKGFRIGVVCVDPTSPFSGGALLGDRIRMKEDYPPGQVFIRSMASRGKLGGVGRATKDTIAILDAYGVEVIIVETVGVGQNEIDVYTIASTTILLLAPGMGDEIQAFKAGIMETSDIYVVNKMDHDGADRLVGEIESMLDLADTIELDHGAGHVVVEVKHQAAAGWRPPICKTNALTGEGVDALWATIEHHRDHLNKSGELARKNRAKFRQEIIDILREKFALHVEEAFDMAKNGDLPALLDDVAARKKDPYAASDGIGRTIADKFKTT